MSVTDAAFEGLNNRYLDLVIAMEKSQARIAELEAADEVHWKTRRTLLAELAELKAQVKDK